MKKIIIGVLLFGMLLAMGCIEWPRPPVSQCTMEAKLCPDGSYVGRVPPDCEFEACPETKYCDATTPCPGGYECYSFEDEDAPICYIGADPCERCSSGMCNIAESYPMQVFCIEEEEPICVDMCGDGICQEIVCMAVGCPCAETPENCPQDCATYEAVNFTGATFPTEDIVVLDYATGDIDDLVRENGFVIVRTYEDDMAEVYYDLSDSGQPILVTTDSTLHAYHVLFDEALMTVEELEFYPELKDITSSLFEKAKERYNTESGDLKEAAKLEAAYFGVALTLLGEEPDAPEEISNLIDSEIEKIEAKEGFQDSSIFHYKEDYSQYQPRGHYTKSETLKKYFKGMMWYGRLTFLQNEGIVNEHETDIQTKAAFLIAKDMEDTGSFETWEKIYEITSYLIGYSDDITPLQYKEILDDNNVETDEDMLAKYDVLRAALAQLEKPAIYSGIMPPDDPQYAGDLTACMVEPGDTKEGAYEECMNASIGMRFMGQRFTIDALTMENLTLLDYTGSDEPFTMCVTQLGPKRCFARGLDVAASLGSDTASRMLVDVGDTEYEGYDGYAVGVRSQMGDYLSEHKEENIYTYWLYTLESISENNSIEGISFTSGEAWNKKMLRTSLASWSELKHDTILYVKQPYSMFVTSAPILPQEPSDVGYVEPYPELYSRLATLSGRTREIFGSYNWDSENMSRILERMDYMENVSLELVEISNKEVNGESLSEDDVDFINGFGSKIDYITGDEHSTTIMVADVFTESNTKQVVEEGVGYVDKVYALCSYGGQEFIAIGPAFTYYEFKVPMDERLTDEAWKRMLEEDDAPEEFLG